MDSIVSAGVHLVAGWQAKQVKPCLEASQRQQHARGSFTQLPRCSNVRSDGRRRCCRSVINRPDGAIGDAC